MSFDGGRLNLCRAKYRSVLSANQRGSRSPAQDPLPDEIKDRGQVRAMWQWGDLDCDNLLWREFCRPIEVETGSKEDLAIQLTEGWILGCSPTATIQ
jgi:hypothetical protein